MNKWLKKISIVLVLVYCAIMFLVGSSATIFLTVVGIVGIAGIYSLATLIKYLKE